jgi:glycosidase
MMPFYPSPLGDDGYDISDYYAVDPRFGTLGDFVEMIRTADNLGIRVLVDLSHTSNKHQPRAQQLRYLATAGGPPAELRHATDR